MDQNLREAAPTAATFAMKLLRKLGNPVALVGQGFVAGALLFTATNPALLHSDSARADAQAAALVKELTR